MPSPSSYPPNDLGGIMKRDLKKFENGKIDRREVLQAFGLISIGAFAASVFRRTAAALAASSAQTAGRDGKAFPVTTVNHLALSAASYSKSREFYVDLFGMRVAW